MMKQLHRPFIMFLLFALLSGLFSSALADRTYSSAIVGADQVAFRTEPKTGSSIYARFDTGTQLKIIDQKLYNCEWLKVGYKNRTGYVNRRFLRLSGMTDAEDFTATVINCTDTVNVRAAADKKSELLGTAALGESFQLKFISIENGYYAVDYRGQTGYISTDFISLTEKPKEDQLSGIRVTGGTLSPAFEPDQYGYVVKVTDDTVLIETEAEKGVKITVDGKRSSSAEISMPEKGTKTVRIRVNGKTRYSLYLTRGVITVGSYNIKRCNQRSLEIGQLLMGEQPDILGVQEVYRIPKTEKAEAVNNLLAIRTAHMSEWLFSPTVLYPSTGEYGIGLLSAYEIEANETRRLTSPESEQRVVQRAQMVIDGKGVSVYNTHLSYESRDIRAVQLGEIAAFMAEDTNEYRILFGDFNIASVDEFAPLTDTMKVLDNDKTRFFDFDATEFTSNRIDNILVTKNITVYNVRKDNVFLSDHRPLFAYIGLD